MSVHKLAVAAAYKPMFSSLCPPTLYHILSPWS